MNRQGWFVDTSVLLLAAGGEHPDREPSRAFLAGALRADRPVHASIEAMREYLFHRMRRADRTSALAETRALFAVLHLHDLTAPIFRRSLGVVESTPLRGRDALHAATALEAGFDRIVTLDRDFAQVPGLAAVHPGQAG
ncbi:MAG: type II toxin-antitoxin system VapC family toxin [Micropruina sp.]|nr:type II toxin-antitoxin system VapC family toxin [Micropruina sp.]